MSAPVGLLRLWPYQYPPPPPPPPHSVANSIKYKFCLPTLPNTIREISLVTIQFIFISQMFEEAPCPPKPFRSEFIARTVSSALWLCLLNCFLALIYSIGSCVLHPTLLFSTDWLVLSPHSISLLIQLNIFSCLFVALFSSCYALKLQMFSSRYNKIVSFCSRQSVTFICIYSTLSWATVFTWRRHDYTLAFYPGERLEELVYLFYGLAFGIYTALSFIASQSNTLSFPVIQQPKLSRIQLEIFSFSKRHLFRSLLRVWVCSSVSLFLLTALSPDWLISHSAMSVLLLILNPIFLLKLCFILSLSLTQNTLAWKLFNISHTHAYRFPCAPNPFPSLLSLPEAVRTSSPLLMCLAFQDLCSLSLHSPQRRAAIFSLDAHTGQGDSWSHIFHACTRLINEFIAKLDTEHSPDISNHSDSIPCGFYSPTPKPGSPDPIPSRSVSSGPCPPLPPRGLQERAWDEAVRLLVRMRRYLECSFLARYFHDPLRLSIYFGAYTEAGLYRWVLVSLSELATAAYQEDKYGLVQRNLSTIISQLLTLSQKLESHKPPSSLYSSQGAGDLKIRELNTLRAGVTSSVASCLHRISITYRSHIYSLGLSSEQQLRLVSLSRDHFSE